MPSLYSLLAIAFVAATVAANPAALPFPEDSENLMVREIDFALPETDLEERDAELNSRATCAAKIVAAAESQKGVPYVYGGGSCTGKTGGGFDCSGLVRFSVHKGKGICLVHSAQSQYLDTKQGKRIPLAKRQPGDIVFWNYGGTCNKGVEHTAIVKNAKTIVVARHTGTKIQDQAFWTHDPSSGMTICPYAMRFC